MSASPPTPDVSLEGNEPTLRANNGSGRRDLITSREPIYPRIALIHLFDIRQRPTFVEITFERAIQA
jgi:hypothetical protein